MACVVLASYLTRKGGVVVSTPQTIDADRIAERVVGQLVDRLNSRGQRAGHGDWNVVKDLIRETVADEVRRTLV